MAEITLETKLVGSITGNFFVPSYQRGYRWGEEEVTRLLDDVYANESKSYCLQPTVVKKTDEGYELIDGQQRLTTLFLIYKYMHDASGGFLDDPQFTLTYKTRERSESFLKSIDMSLREDNVDFFFIANAYETIANWFGKKDKKSTLTNINKYFDENVKVIWYEVDNDEDSIGLFTRLNIGKIPLTSAELVKAMFLCRGETAATPQGKMQAQIDREKQEEISLQWDNIEKELHNDSLWFFLTNSSDKNYQTRIDLVLDMMVKKPAASKETYYTFFEFDKLRKETELDVLWRTIQNTFLILKDWFENHELYHKIGYPIATGVPLSTIYEFLKDKTKRQFAAELDGRIRESIAIKKNYGELSYEKKNDYDNISKLLLLFNVESVRQNGEQTQWFPFDKFKYEKGHKVAWSLEHIHAQQSEGMRTQEVWKEWLRLHIPSVQSLGGHDDLIQQMEALRLKDNLNSAEFLAVQSAVLTLLSASGSTEYLHSISNLALLSTTDNAALNNSTFDVKRNEIIEMDKAGQYIPFCTKMVFLKYYTPSSDNQLHFWGQADRVAYVQAINKTLEKYLPAPIVLEKEVQ